MDFEAKGIKSRKKPKTTWYKDRRQRPEKSVAK